MKQLRGNGHDVGGDIRDVALIARKLHCSPLGGFVELFVFIGDLDETGPLCRLLTLGDA